MPDPNKEELIHAISNRTGPFYLGFIPTLSDDDITEVLQTTSKEGSYNFLIWRMAREDVEDVRELLGYIENRKITTQLDILNQLTIPIKALNELTEEMDELTAGNANAIMIATYEVPQFVSPILKAIIKLQKKAKKEGHNNDFIAPLFTQISTSKMNVLMYGLFVADKQFNNFIKLLNVIETLSPQAQKQIFMQLSCARKNVFEHAVTQNRPKAIAALVTSSGKLPLESQLEFIQQYDHPELLRQLRLKQFAKRDNLPVDLADLYTTRADLHEVINGVLHDLMNSPENYKNKYRKENLLLYILTTEQKKLPSISLTTTEINDISSKLHKLLRNYQDITNITTILLDLYVQHKTEPELIELIKNQLTIEAKLGNLEAYMAFAIIADIEGNGPMKNDWLTQLNKIAQKKIYLTFHPTDKVVASALLNPNANPTRHYSRGISEFIGRFFENIITITGHDDEDREHIALTYLTNPINNSPF